MINTYVSPTPSAGVTVAIESQEGADPSRPWLKALPLAFTVIPNYKVITDANRLTIGHLDSISDSTLEVTIPEKDRTLVLSISRYDGTLIGTSTMGDPKGKPVKLQGSCDRHEPYDRDF